MPLNPAQINDSELEAYIINNMTLDDRFGPMVRLVKFLYDDRQKFFEQRFRLPEYGSY